ncbi:ABC transporter permease [Staphylococcus debuckii]|uniref:ABC transporter permease n=1 Tax=Staphylococcus debuckii TaxID=2044912 RepID=UPI000F435A93|nr:ABC transporter permease [Staphylococcus debuckii]AYU55958.1 ABC transporter permease [Staphylococcus debuckii]
MSKFWATFSLTYMNKIKSRAFIIMTVIIALLIIGGANANKIIDMFSGGPDKIGIVTDNQQVYQMVKSQSEKLEDKGTKFEHLSEQQALKNVKKEKLDKAYIISFKGQQIEGKIVSKDSVSNEAKQKLESILTPIQTQAIAKSVDLSPKDLQALQQKSKVTSQAIGKNAQQLSEQDKVANIIILYAGIMLMFFIIINYANQVAMEVATEKTSRVIEMVITSISPVKHIIAKILAIIAVAFSQIFIFAIVGVISIYLSDLKDVVKKFNMKITDVTMQLLIVGVICLVIGIISYTILGTILGSLATRIEDMNQALMPMTIVSFIAFYIAIFSLNTPETTLTKITSFIPLISPFVLFLRASTPELQLWEIIVSVILSLIVMVLLLWIAVRSYRDSVLTFEKGFFKGLKRAFKKS